MIKFKYSILLTIILTVGISFGIAFQKYQFFPYDYIKTTYNHLTAEIDGPWSIGIYEGPTPFKLHDPIDVSNPVITAKDVDDIKAKFVADPFLLLKDKKFFMFFEVLNQETNLGEIGYAESKNGKEWDYKKIIIKEKFHLSYPYIFEWNGNYYIIPESNEDFSVRLYKAVSFPEKWKYMGKLLSGYRYVDPSIFRYNNMWWMLVSTVDNSELNLYFSENLLKGWQPHPMNPIVKGDKNIARPGGRVLVDNGKIYRFTQDCDPSYGNQIFAFEITELTEKTYKEHIVSEMPIITKSGKGWNASGMHQVDSHKVGNQWISAVDGRDR